MKRTVDILAGVLLATLTVVAFARWMLGKEPQIEAAKRELEGLSDGLENSTIWQYLVWRCLTLSGEKEAGKSRSRESKSKSGG